MPPPANVIIGSPPGNGILNGTWKVKFAADPKVGRRKTASLTQMVAAGDITASEDDIAATAGLPLIYGLYGGMWCKELNLEDAGPGQHPVTHSDTRMWRVTSTFDSELDTNSSETNPLLRPVIISRDSVVVDERLYFDAVTGVPITTFLGEPLYCTGPYVMPTLTFTRYEAYPYPDANILNYTGAVNAGVFRGAPIGTALMLKVRTNEVTIKNVRYEQVSYSVQFRIDRYNPSATNTWQEKIPHAGYWYRDEPGGPVFYNQDRDGVSRGTVYNLNANGTKKAEGAAPDLFNVNRMRSVAFPVF